MVKIQIVDQTVFEIDNDAAILSGLLRTIALVDPHQQDGAVGINVHSAEAMDVIVTYINHYKSMLPFSRISRPLYNTDLRLSGVNDFDASLIESLSLNLVRSVLVAADYLDIPSLTELCCARLAAYIKTVPLTQMMQRLGITELSAAWAEITRKKHPWCKIIQTP
jgi:hypothetical protein